MKKSPSPEFLVVFAVLIALAIVWFLPALTLFHRPPVDDKVPLAERVKTILGVELEALENSLALTPVITGEEPFILTYSMPFDMEAITWTHVPKDRNAHQRTLVLWQDGKDADAYEFFRQTNGTYQVKWNTMFASFGPHTLQVGLAFGPHYRLRVYGPKRTEYVTNLVRFDPDTTSFGSRAWIYGILQVPTAEYKIEIYDTNKTLLKTINGHTDKGLIDEVWDLRTEGGHVRADEEFEAKVYIRPIFVDTNNPTGTNAASFSDPYPYWLFRIGKAGAGLLQ